MSDRVNPKLLDAVIHAEVAHLYRRARTEAGVFRGTVVELDHVHGEIEVSLPRLIGAPRKVRMDYDDACFDPVYRHEKLRQLFPELAEKDSLVYTEFPC